MYITDSIQMLICVRAWRIYWKTRLFWPHWTQTQGRWTLKNPFKHDLKFKQEKMYFCNVYGLKTVFVWVQQFTTGKNCQCFWNYAICSQRLHLFDKKCCNKVNIIYYSFKKNFQVICTCNVRAKIQQSSVSHDPSEIILISNFMLKKKKIMLRTAVQLNIH